MGSEKTLPFLLHSLQFFSQPGLPQASFSVVALLSTPPQHPWPGPHLFVYAQLKCLIGDGAALAFVSLPWIGMGIAREPHYWGGEKAKFSPFLRAPILK